MITRLSHIIFKCVDDPSCQGKSSGGREHYHSQLRAPVVRGHVTLNDEASLVVSLKWPQQPLFLLMAALCAQFIKHSFTALSIRAIKKKLPRPRIEPSTPATKVIFPVCCNGKSHSSSKLTGNMIYWKYDFHISSILYQQFQQVLDVITGNKIRPHTAWRPIGRKVGYVFILITHSPIRLQRRYQPNRLCNI